MDIDAILAEGADEMARASHSAFPQNIHTTNGAVVNIYGLTKRELFAAMAMQGLTAAIQEYHATTLINGPAIAIDAVSIADALLKELEQK